MSHNFIVLYSFTSLKIDVTRKKTCFPLSLSSCAVKVKDPLVVNIKVTGWKTLEREACGRVGWGSVLGQGWEAREVLEGAPTLPSKSFSTFYTLAYGLRLTSVLQVVLWFLLSRVVLLFSFCHVFFLFDHFPSVLIVDYHGKWRWGFICTALHCILFYFCYIAVFP